MNCILTFWLQHLAVVVSFWLRPSLLRMLLNRSLAVFSAGFISFSLNRISAVRVKVTIEPEGIRFGVVMMY